MRSAEALTRAAAPRPLRDEVDPEHYVGARRAAARVGASALRRPPLPSWAAQLSALLEDLCAFCALEQDGNHTRRNLYARIARVVMNNGATTDMLPHGMVIDTRVFDSSTSSMIAPARTTDSAALNTLHRGVTRDFSLPVR